jgi:hypothetical protein
MAATWQTAEQKSSGAAVNSRLQRGTHEQALWQLGLTFITNGSLRKYAERKQGYKMFFRNKSAKRRKLETASNSRI